ncbi:MAG TPA: PKD domain-containing protein [Anaerolineae bacterium]|nr:PKD domain-containing protein [Anaerolineae bacterium]
MLNVCPTVQNTPFFTIAYGTVTLDGQNVPVGTTVEARSPRGDVTGCFEVTAVGNYGMMYIYGEDTTVTPPIPGMRAGETVIFYVNGSSASAAPTLTWVDDKSWHQVNLIAVGVADADFSGTPRQGTAPLAVSFTNLSIGDFTTCAWTFGDGGTSASCGNPGHTYTNPGVYNVSLTVSGTLGSNIETKMGYITVYTPVSAQFSATPTLGVAPLIVAFTNTSTGDYTNCAWDFGDDITSTVCAPPAHTYSNPGVYDVTLTVSGHGSSDTETKTNYITVYAHPVADFNATPTTGVAPLLVTFTNLSTGTFSSSLWSFGDGITSTMQHPTHTYTTTGIYTVSLSIQGAAGADTRTRVNFITVREKFEVFLPLVIREH